MSAGGVQWLGLAGPTASGKSAASLALARTLGRPVEIVSVDSALVYRGMDIGTAKPTRAELAAVPHHLIDILDPRDSYSAAQFCADARRLVAEIQARGALPLLVGGTMLYFKALLDGLDEMPPADPAVRAELDAQAAGRGWPALHAELALVDPATAARLAPNDAQRIQRALEVWRSTGRPISSFHGQRTTPDSRDSTPLVSLEPASRAWLHERIAQRFDAMLAAGLVDEVKALRARGDLHAGLPSMRCVGYRQAWEALDSGDLQPLRERGIAATRQLAKRQLTWLRSMPQRHVVACDAPDAVQQVLAVAARCLATPGNAG
ncbi:tRNA (adenosine(37)-N6)-dimethylallyltransferase MiaA [Ideonella sp. BN130291]|uniref:tRNA (adenosine(37)-N6)-dimethylallyltransferase MiaA n=1 Tax=Ideonella sp. BN130291 TaxID=3112940 RepID=UPI002E25CF13|nr:tRNA (adenosine(37)-N6)-dimethylallyltransferase MiaA [Ideonella sp. BN130291]